MAQPTVSASSTPGKPAPPAGGGVDSSTPASRWSGWLQGAIFFFFVLFAILLPHSIKGAERAWRAAFLLWLGKLGLDRKLPFSQPLSAPLLAYVALSGVSTALTTDPYLSWDRMKIVCLVLLGIVFAQNLRRLSHIRILVVLFLLSGCAAGIFTAWQYTYGIGMRVAYILPGSPLYDAGVHHDDIVTRINGSSVHTLAQLQQRVAELPTRQPMRIDLLRGAPFEKLQVTITREGLVDSGYSTRSLQFERGKPFRAQGTLGHYIVFAEMLMQLGCLTWALVLGTTPQHRWLRAGLIIVFLVIAVTLIATETRAALAGLALGCLLSLFLLTGKRMKILGGALLLVLVVVGSLVIHYTRGINWTASNDVGRQFRILMWEDGLRLVREHPWFGVGMETVRFHWIDWNIRGFILYHVQSHFHSTPLQIAVERGLTTLAAWIWFVVAYIVFLVRLIGKVRGRSAFATSVVTGVFAGFVAFVTTSAVHYNLGEEPLVMCLFFFFGLAIAIDHLLTVPGAFDVP